MSTLKPGDTAPLFSFVDQHGNTLNLTDFLGSKVVIYFYPKDDTPGCTAEACNLRDNNEQLLSYGYKIIGISTDSVRSHIKFSEKYSLPFPLASDTDKSIARAYGVWGPKKFLGKTYDGITRTTFIIDEQGLIERVIAKVDTKNHSEQILT